MPIHCFLCHHVGLADTCQVFWSLEQDQHVLLAAGSISHILGCIESHFLQVNSPQFSAIIPWGSILGTWWAGSLQNPMDPGQFAYGSQPTNSLQHPTARFWFFEAVLCHDGLAWLRLAFLYLDPKTISPHTGRVGSCARHWGQRLAETIWETRTVAIKAIICLCCSFRFFLAAILWNAACIKNDTK